MNHSSQRLPQASFRDDPKRIYPMALLERSAKAAVSAPAMPVAPAPATGEKRCRLRVTLKEQFFLTHEAKALD